MKAKRSICICLLLGLSVLQAVAAPDRGELKGRVIDARTGGPLVAADVSLIGTDRRTVCDERGEFLFEGLPAGNYRLAVESFGYRSVESDEIALAAGRIVSVELALEIEPIVFEELIVTAEREVARPGLTIDRRRIGERKPADIGQFLRSASGMSAVRKGGTALDVVLRGFRREQLNVQIDGGAQVYGACPNRMDPPTSHVQAEDLEKIEIIRGPHAVRYGPALGGLINLAMTRPQQSEELELHGKLESGYEENAAGKRVRGMVFGSQRNFDFYLSAGEKDYGDYSDGDGEEVASSFQVRDYSLKLGWKPDVRQRLQLSVRQSFERDALYPALPMDADEDDTDLVALDYTYRHRGSRLRQLSAKVYLTAVDHLMTNGRKSTWVNMHAATDVETQTGGGRFELAVAVADGKLFVGGDFRRLSMDGFRTREMMMGEMAGKVMRDIIWPDAYSHNFGLFGQFDRPLSPRLDLSLGARLDRTQTAADNPEASFVAIHGADMERTDVNPAASLSLTYRQSERLQVNGAVGLGRRSPSITERYLYLLPTGVDRYDYLGDPDVDPEQNLQFDVGITYRTERAYASGSAFYARLSGLISARLDEGVTARSPGVLGVKRFFNIDRARQVGGELEGGYLLGRGWGLKGQLSYVRGTDLGGDRPLPEIPPLEGNLALRYEDGRRGLWAELGERVVARQERISAEFGESETPGFSVTRLAAGVDLREHVRLSGGVDNLLDETYYEHLNRMQKADGLPISEMGRSLYLLLELAM